MSPPSVLSALSAPDDFLDEPYPPTPEARRVGAASCLPSAAHRGCSVLRPAARVTSRTTHGSGAPASAKNSSGSPAATLECRSRRPAADRAAGRRGFPCSRAVAQAALLLRQRAGWRRGGSAADRTVERHVSGGRCGCRVASCRLLAYTPAGSLPSPRRARPTAWGASGAVRAARADLNQRRRRRRGLRRTRSVSSRRTTPGDASMSDIQLDPPLAPNPSRPDPQHLGVRRPALRVRRRPPDPAQAQRIGKSNALALLVPYPPRWGHGC